MEHGIPGAMIFKVTAPDETPTILAYTPVNRGALQNYISILRQTQYGGVQVPVRVIHVDCETGQDQEELIPGCATCSI